MEDREPYITGGSKMNRENKYRAWDTKVTQPMWSTEETLSLIMFQDRVSRGLAEDKNGRLERFKIMQYTGLKDKNGKEIYEGDVLSGCYGIPPKQVRSVVEFKDGSFINKTPKDNPKQITTFEFMICLDPEVIGNIYEDENKVDKGDK